jgi:hypothetical protein
LSDAIIFRRVPLERHQRHPEVELLRAAFAGIEQIRSLLTMQVIDLEYQSYLETVR